MSVNYAYAYAKINNSTNMCVGVVDTTNPTMDGSTNGVITYVMISEYNEDYILKYYNWDNGKFYYDAEYTQEFIPE